jgi:hypothetical protein
MKTHYELSMTYAELHRRYRASGANFICWMLQEDMERRHASELPEDYYPSWNVNEDVAVIIYNKYREFVPSPDNWSIVANLGFVGNRMLIEQFGLLCLFSPNEVNEILGGVIDVESTLNTGVVPDGGWSDVAKFDMFFNNGIRPTHVYKFREHVLSVIAKNDPEAIITISCDI